MNYRRTNASTRRCTFPDCGTPTDRLRDVKGLERLRALKMKKIYIPKRARVCKLHCSENLWNLAMQEGNMIFTKTQIEDLIILATRKEVEKTNTAVGPYNIDTMKTYIGLNSEQYENILRVTLPSLLRIYKSLDKAKAALYIYLMKLRTGFTNAEIAPLFGVNERVIILRIRNVREIIYREFVPLHLFNWNREDLLRSISPLSRRLYNVNNGTVVISFDGTYMYTIASSNYSFQKETYSVQKKRNLVKFMMCVSTDGLILGAYGPFSARKNDASILEEIMREQNNIFELLLPGDVVVLDRGFRDCVRLLQNRGFIVKIPAFIGNKKSQFTTQQANTTRNATKTRFVVEVKNGHVKNQWKLLKSMQIHQSIPYLKQNFQIAVALLNAFSAKVLSDKYDWNHIATTMIAKVNNKNDMLRFVQHIPRTSFDKVNNLSLFPKMTYEELKNISQGTYQIKQAKSYVQLHLKANNNNFVTSICDPAAFQRYCGQMGQYSKPLLLLLNLPSRFISRKIHQTYVLLNENSNDGYTVEKYCCSCINGKRTVGCCSHVMTIIWYTVHVDQSKLHLPSTNLNAIFDRN